MASVDLNDVAGEGAPDQRAAVVAFIRALPQVDPGSLARAQLVSSRTGQPAEQVLNHLGGLSDDDLAAAYQAVLGCAIWDPEAEPIQADPRALNVTLEFLRRARLAPVREAQGVLVCAACDPLDREAISGLVFATGRRVSVIAARPADWIRAFDLTFAGSAQDEVAPDERRLEREIDQVSDSAAAGAGARLVASVFEAAIANGASDIHFEPRRHDLNIRLRIDGRLMDWQAVSADLASPAVSRVKVIANLDLGERRLPQDGRTTFVVAGRQVDVRVATSPTVFGESAVLRILDRSSVPLDLDTLSLDAPIVSVLRRAAKAPHGMFLVTGPTGSGKTTTLYALLQTFAGSAKKVLSIEDPVEFHFEHVSQTQVAAQLGLTFAKALRSFLRQDPDVILVGEIRDPETAAVAVQAAMTGHLVLASVHANDAVAVAPRLRNMGVEPYQLAAALRGAAAQRLVRKLCPICRRMRPANEAERRFVESLGGVCDGQVWEAVGCGACKQLGFKGRILIAEAFLADDEVIRCVAGLRPMSELGAAAREAGLKPMAEAGLGKAALGLTTLEEVRAAVDG